MAKHEAVGAKPGLCGVGRCFYARTKGWPRSGFEWRETEITVDRLDYEGRDELRLTILIRTKTEKRVTETHGSVTLPDGHALAFIAACGAKRVKDAA